MHYEFVNFSITWGYFQSSKISGSDCCDDNNDDSDDNDDNNDDSEWQWWWFWWRWSQSVCALVKQLGSIYKRAAGGGE